MRNRLLMGRLLYICVGFFLGNLAGCSASHFCQKARESYPQSQKEPSSLAVMLRHMGTLVWALRADVSQVCLWVRPPPACCVDGQQLLTIVYCTQSGCLEGSGYN